MFFFTDNRNKIQLWQFILQLLLDSNRQQIISWTGDGWEFKLNNPTEVVRLWGLRKKKPSMNYDTLSRGLRHCYDSNIMQKVNKKFVYCFHPDMCATLKYSVEELCDAYELTPTKMQQPSMSSRKMNQSRRKKRREATRETRRKSTRKRSLESEDEHEKTLKKTRQSSPVHQLNVAYSKMMKYGRRSSRLMKKKPQLKYPKVHLPTIPILKPQSINCPKCRESFSEWSELISHLNTHSQ